MYSSTLPRSIQAQADAANTAIAELNQPPQTENPADAAPAQPTEPAQPSPTPAAAAPQEPAQQAVETRDASYWQHRFNVMKGKYDAEVPQLNTRINELTRQLQEAQRAAPAASAPQRAQEALADLSQEELDQFGPDLVALVQRIASKVAAPASPASTAELETLRSEVGQLKDERQQDATARFWADLERAVPSFREINSDQRFHAWLSELDAVTGLPRQQLLANAQQDLSAYRVAALFNQFTQFNPVAAQPAVKSTPQVPEDQIQPGQSRAGGDVVQPSSQLRTWSSAEISAFYRDKAAGKYSQADAAALEADIFAAQRQGRITA